MAIFLLIISSFSFFSNSYISNNTSQHFNEIKYSEDLKIKINGEEITSSDVNEQFRKIPEQSRKNVTRDQVMESLIEKKLLLQEAERKGIGVSDKDIDTYLEQVKGSRGLDEAGLEEKLLASGYTLSEYRKSVSDMLAVSRFLDQELNLQNVGASDADVNGFIEANMGEFQDILDEEYPELEEFVRSKIKKQLTREKQQGIVKEYLESLKKNAKIEGGNGV